MRYHPVLLAILLAGCQQDTAPRAPTAPTPLPEVAGPIRAEQLPPPLARGWENLILDLAVEAYDDETARITWTQPEGGGWAEIQRVRPFRDSWLSRGSTTVRDGECEVSSGGTCAIADDGTLLYEPRADATDGKYWFRIRERTPWPEGWIRYNEDGRYWPWSEPVEVTLKGKKVRRDSGGSGGEGSGGGTTGGGGLKCGTLPPCPEGTECRRGSGGSGTYICVTHPEEPE